MSNNNMKVMEQTPQKKDNWIVRLWKNIIWFFTEMVNLWSDKPSYFSKKRVESGIAFIIAQIGMVWYLYNKGWDMDIYEFLMWAGAEFLIAGYAVNQIQREKKSKPQPEEEEQQ